MQNQAEIACSGQCLEEVEKEWLDLASHLEMNNVISSPYETLPRTHTYSKSKKGDDFYVALSQ